MRRWINFSLWSDFKRCASCVYCIEYFPILYLKQNNESKSFLYDFHNNNNNNKKTCSIHIDKKIKRKIISEKKREIYIYYVFQFSFSFHLIRLHWHLINLLLKKEERKFFFVDKKKKIIFVFTVLFRCCFIIHKKVLWVFIMNMKMQIFCGFLLVILLMNTQHNCGVRADDKNITRLLNNQVIVSRQIMCVLDKSPCDQLGRQLKGT